MIFLKQQGYINHNVAKVTLSLKTITFTPQPTLFFMRKILLLILIFTLAQTTVAQRTHIVYTHEYNLMEGDKESLYKIAQYLDVRDTILETLGYHILHPEIRHIATRIIEENTSFLPNEFPLDSTATATKFKNFLQKNDTKIFFDERANTFLLTPLEQRTIRTQLRQLPTERMAALANEKQRLMKLNWVKFNQIDSLVTAKNPKALLAIASEYYRQRGRYDRYNFDGENFTDLLELLTGIGVGVENRRGNIIWNIHKEYDDAPILNLLIFYTQHYKDFKWDDKTQLFINKSLTVGATGIEQRLVEQMKTKDGAKALESFIKLTECDPDRVKGISAEMDKIKYELNFSIPQFPDRFAVQLAYLTKYCREQNIDYKGSAYLKKAIEKLNSKISFKERWALENELIHNLTLKDITAFEYWSLINEKNWYLTNSAGRILDIFYSRHWSAILTNQKQLEHYLKKSALFNRLSINGICLDYLIKFDGASPEVLKTLTNLHSKDADVTQRAKMALEIQGRRYVKHSLSDMETKTFYVKDFEIKLNAILKDYKDSEEERDTLTSLLSEISYKQIGTALTQLNKLTFKDNSKIYSFLNRDFGFFLMGYDKGHEERYTFLNLYNKYTEYELYAYYLDEAGITYKNPDGTLDYDAIYDHLKYDETTVLAGGGSSKDNGVYATIKLLEITFNTTLGFSNKYCSSNNMYACDSDVKVMAWLAYLKENKLLKKEHNEPPSFHKYKYSYNIWGRNY